jgi:hypothetical protein
MLGGCSPTQRKAAVAVTTTIADDICHEVEQQPQPDWVDLVCAVEGAVADVVRVRMPRAQWAELLARHVDAGPGK